MERPSVKLNTENQRLEKEEEESIDKIRIDFWLRMTTTTDMSAL